MDELSATMQAVTSPTDSECREHLWENVAVITAAVDRGTIINANRCAWELFGYLQGELVGVSLATLLPKENLIESSGLHLTTGFRKDGGTLSLNVLLASSFFKPTRKFVQVVVSEAVERNP